MSELLHTLVCDECGEQYRIQKHSETRSLFVACECGDYKAAVKVASKIPGEPTYEQETT